MISERLHLSALAFRTGVNQNHRLVSHEDLKDRERTWSCPWYTAELFKREKTFQDYHMAITSRKEILVIGGTGAQGVPVVQSTADTTSSMALQADT